MMEAMSTLLPIAASLKHLSLGGNRRLGGCFIPVDMLVQFQRLTFLGLSALNLIGESHSTILPRARPTRFRFKRTTHQI